jgi:hypothetical protein
LCDWVQSPQTVDLALRLFRSGLRLQPVQEVDDALCVGRSLEDTTLVIFQDFEPVEGRL